MKLRRAIALAVSVALHLGAAGALSLAVASLPRAMEAERTRYSVELQVLERTAAYGVEGSGGGVEPAPRAAPLPRPARGARRVAAAQAAPRADAQALLEPEAPLLPVAPAAVPVAEVSTTGTAVPIADGLPVEAGTQDGEPGGSGSGGTTTSGGSAVAAAGAANGGGGGSGTGGQGSPGLLLEISRLLAAQASGCYPRAAQRFRLEGTAKVRFCVGEGGEPLDTQLIESSGKPLLDEGAFCTVAHAAPFPASGECVTVPIRFSLAR
jgi:protein TonB